jgi:hypothetical protein
LLKFATSSPVLRVSVTRNEIRRINFPHKDSRKCKDKNLFGVLEHRDVSLRNDHEVFMEIAGYGRHRVLHSLLSEQKRFRSTNTEHALQALQQYRTTTF